MLEKFRIERLIKKFNKATEEQKQEIAFEIYRLISDSKNKDPLLKIALKAEVLDLTSCFCFDLSNAVDDSETASIYQNISYKDILSEIEELEINPDAFSCKLFLILNNLQDSTYLQIIKERPDLLKYVFKKELLRKGIDYIIENDVEIDYEKLLLYRDSKNIQEILKDDRFVKKTIKDNPENMKKIGDSGSEQIIIDAIKKDSSYAYYYKGDNEKIVDFIMEVLTDTPVNEVNKLADSHEAYYRMLEKALQENPNNLFKIHNINLYYERTLNIIDKYNIDFSYENVSKWKELIEFINPSILAKIIKYDKKNIAFITSLGDGNYGVETENEIVDILFKIIKEDFSILSYLKEIEGTFLRENVIDDVLLQNKKGKEIIKYIITKIREDSNNLQYITNLFNTETFKNEFITALKKDISILRYLPDIVFIDDETQKIIDEIVINRVKENPKNIEYYYGRNPEIYAIAIERGAKLNLKQLKAIQYDANSFTVDNIIVKELFKNIISLNNKLNNNQLLELFKYLITNNDEIINTTDFRIFDEKYFNLFITNNIINKELLRLILRYEDIQEKIIKIVNKLNNVTLLKEMLNYIYKNDTIETLYTILDNLSDDNYMNYYNIASKAFANNPNKKDIIINNIVYITSNVIKVPINNEQDIIEFEQKQDHYYQGIINNIDDNATSLDMVKEAVLMEKYGITLDKTIEIVEKYASDLNIEEEKLSDKDKIIINILKSLKEIIECDDKYKLGILYKSISNNTELSIKQTVILEKEIRALYARQLNKDLLSIEDMKDTGLDKRYGIKIYEAFDEDNPKEFKILLTCLGAYSGFTRPSDFKANWLRPKEISHGFCTSLISNEMLGTAKMNACLAFTNIEEGNLLLSSPFDIGSDTQKRSIVGEHSKEQIQFLFPDKMINSTRHTHNEMVIERLIESGKVYPSYVIYMTEDFDILQLDSLEGEEKERWELAKQAAKDLGIPLVVVDRGKIKAYEEKERAKLLSIVSKGTKESPKALYRLLERFENNRAGCREYWLDDNLKREDILNLLKKIENIINNMINDDKLDIALECCLSIMKWINDEYTKTSKKMVQVGEKELGVNILEVKRIVESLKERIDKKTKKKGTYTDSNELSETYEEEELFDERKSRTI